MDVSHGSYSELQLFVPLSTLSLISFHAALVVFGSTRESKKASTAFAF
jgi:hypothetical protein